MPTSSTVTISDFFVFNSSLAALAGLAQFQDHENHTNTLAFSSELFVYHFKLSVYHSVAVWIQYFRTSTVLTQKACDQKELCTYHCLDAWMALGTRLLSIASQSVSQPAAKSKCEIVHVWIEHRETIMISVAAHWLRSVMFS